MSDIPIFDKFRRETLIKPLNLSRPTVSSITCEIEFPRATAEAMFKTLVFEDEDTSVIITEVLRPVLPGEASVFFHTGAGVGFCVDHYEFDGVTL